MSETTPQLTAAERATIAFETGITNGVVDSVNGWDWGTSTPLAAIYAPELGSTHKWGSGEIGTSATITYAFDPGSDFTAAQEATYVAAMTLWSDEAGVTFVEASDPTQAEVTYSLAGSTTPGAPGLPGNAFESSTYTAVAPGSSTAAVNTSAILAIDTVSYGNLSSFSDLTAGGSIATIVHELGHLVGLAHAGPYNFQLDALTQQYSAADMKIWTTMSYISPSDSPTKYSSSYPVTGTNWNVANDPSTPQMLDILGAQELYGLSTSTTYSGGQIFGFNTNISDASSIFFNFTINTNPIVTIWDSGTGNTLDLSGFYTPSVVNLNAGSFSSVDGMVNNIGIAYGTAIDTLIGGYGNDTITVNGDSDTINGGGGTNTVIFSEAMANYHIARASDGSITVSYGAITDQLTNIQTLEFADQTVLASALPLDETIYRWAGGDGSFAEAASWIDEATGQAATTPPDTTISAVIAGPTSGSPETILGTGEARQLTFTGMNGVTGALSATVLTVGDGASSGDSLTIAPGATISATTAALVNGTLLDQGLLKVSGLMTVAPDEAAATALLSVQNGGTAQIQSLVLQGGSLSVDTTSFLDIGTVATPSAGSIEIGSDGTLSGYGIYGPSVGGTDRSVIDNGLILVTGGTLALPSVSGSGRVVIGANSTLSLTGTAVGITGITISFADATGVLAVTGSSASTFGTIASFVAGDEILLSGLAAPLAQPVFTANTDGSGLLQLYSTTGDLTFSANLAGNYAGNVFIAVPVGSGGYEIQTAPGSLTGSTTPSQGTSGSIFAWSASGAGDWNTAGNWAVFNADTQTQSTATIAPGANDTVFIGSPGQPATLVISGDGNAKALSFLGSEALSGQVSTATLEVGAVGDGASLALIGTAGLTVSTTATISDSSVYVAGGTSFAVGGSLTVSASTSLSSSALVVYGGASVQVGSLVLAGATTSISVDGASSLEVGRTGGASTGGVTVDAGSTISGFGNLSTVAVVNNGTVLVTGGTLAVKYALGNGEYDIGANATLSTLYATAGAFQPTFAFTGSDATLLMSLTGAKLSVSLGLIRDFVLGDSISFGAIQAEQPTTVVYTNTGSDIGTLVFSNISGPSSTMTILGAYQQSDFLLNQTAPGVTSLTIACFAQGTRIATPAGERPVEALAVGERVMTQDGREAAIRWIGHRHVDCRRHPRPEAVMPVRVAKGAFGPGLPARDLWLSPDHALYAEGVLVPVKYLIDGRSVVQEPVDTITYWHVELAEHDVILAEGLPAESYLDTGDRASFAEAGTLTTLHPAWGCEARDVSLIMEALGYAPLCVTGPKLEAVRARLRPGPARRPRRQAMRAA